MEALITEIAGNAPLAAILLVIAWKHDQRLTIIETLFAAHLKEKD